MAHHREPPPCGAAIQGGARSDATRDDVGGRIERDRQGRRNGGAHGLSTTNPRYASKLAAFVLGLRMAETKSIFDVLPDEAEEARLDAAAEAEIETGQGVPHSRVREWLARLGNGEKVPPPTA
jgi:hypothetical protein